MADYPYCPVLNKLKEVMSKIRNVGVPAKLNETWLQSLGYKSSNDRTILKVLKFIHFTDSSGKPGENWLKYRGMDHKSVLADAIRTGYSELYSVYPDAHQCSATELEHFFSTHTSGGQQVIGKMISTFKVLCELADFGYSPNPSESSEPANFPTNGVPLLPSPPKPAPPEENQREFPTFHIDIQVHISPDSTPEQIDQIFASMAKHLYRR